MAKAIMVQGTMSNSGKSFLTAGLCRVFKQDGYKVAPFKSQNMALNSYITKEGLEIGRAQAMQAEACGIDPTADMNPILLKPTSNVGSQVIVNGEVRGNMKAMDYYKNKAFPLLLGTSRKRVIGEGSRQSEPKQRIYGNIAADTVAIMQGVDIIRLHDVLHEKQGIYMAQALRDAYVK